MGPKDCHKASSSLKRQAFSSISLRMKLLIDMDGVLVNFMKGIIDYYDLPFDPYPCPGSEEFYPYLGMSKTRFWKGLGEEFWATLEWMSDGEKILHLAEEQFGHKNICVLSSPSAHSSCLAGKFRWIQKHMPDYRRQYLIGPAKHFCAGNGTILLDDLDRNVDKFRKCGGKAILVPRPWNSAYERADQAVEIVREELAKVS